MRIEITIPGEAFPKLRPIVLKNGRTVTPAKTVKYEKLVRDCWHAQSGEKLQDDKPIKIIVICSYTVPESYTKKKKTLLIGRPKITKPDLDNLVKSVVDGLQGYAFSEDARIFKIDALKIYGPVAKTKVILEDIEQIEEAVLGGNNGQNSIAQ